MNLAERFAPHPPSNTALICDGRETTYGALAERVGRWHGQLEADGLVAGDRVVILAGNTEVFLSAYLACLSGGLIAVPLNPAAPPPELARELKYVEPRAVIVGARGLPAWGEVCAQMGSDGPAATASVEKVYEADGLLIPELEKGTPRPVTSVADDHPAILLFTSGTAGLPKPAILTHDNLWASLQALMATRETMAEESHVTLAVIPLFHIFGLNVIINLSLMAGATMVLGEFVNAKHTAELIADNGATIVAGPPTLWSALLNDPSVSADDMGTVSIAVSGASKLDPRVKIGIAERFRIDLREGYGLTETSGTVTTAMGTDAPTGSVGKMFPGLELRVVDSQGDDVYIGDPGEVWVRGRVVSPGYWNDDEATARTRTEDGWLKTGDMAVVDDEGNLAIVDRMKDLIIVSGFNVHPGEVESILNRHPAVQQSAVVGESDGAMGERIVAHIVPIGDQPPSEDVLIDFCRGELARYKVPKRFVFTDSLPTGLGGKLLRNKLV